MESELVWIAGITIGIDVMSFVQDDATMERLTDELLRLPDAVGVEGPFINGIIVVKFKDTEDTADILRNRVYNVARKYQRKIRVRPKS